MGKTAEQLIRRLRRALFRAGLLEPSPVPPWYELPIQMARGDIDLSAFRHIRQRASIGRNMAEIESLRLRWKTERKLNRP